MATQNRPRAARSDLYVVLNDSTIKVKYRGEKIRELWKENYLVKKEFSSGGIRATEVNPLSLKLYFPPPIPPPPQLYVQTHFCAFASFLENESLLPRHTAFSPQPGAQQQQGQILLLGKRGRKGNWNPHSFL